MHGSRINYSLPNVPLVGCKTSASSTRFGQHHGAYCLEAGNVSLSQFACEIKLVERGTGEEGNVMSTFSAGLSSPQHMLSYP